MNDFNPVVSLLGMIIFYQKEELHINAKICLGEEEIDSSYHRLAIVKT
jgi:hypothetical protein